MGKSSLINALLGYQRAIVFDEPGTTRDVVTGETAFDGWPVALSDTAGIRDQAGGLEAAGILLARDRLRTADLQLLVLDLGEPVAEDDLKLLRDWPDALVVAHKSDRLDCWQKERPANSILVSSVRGDGLNELQQRIVARLVPKVPEPGTPIPVTERQLGLLKRIRDSGSKRTREQAVLELLESSPVSP